MAPSQTTDSVSAVSQNPPSVDTVQAVNNFLELSLDDLMNTAIVSASKEKESSFDAPIASCDITRQEIINMGSTSIPDALRLCLAILVREIANGAYDVSIRGAA
jgi:iron complex outermembrane receptor protein